MAGPVEKLKDIEKKIDDLAVDIDGQSTSLESIDTKVTKIPSIDTETIAQGLTLDAIEIEQSDQGKTLDNIETKH